MAAENLGTSSLPRSRWQVWLANGRELSGPATWLLVTPFIALALFVFVYPLVRLLIMSFAEPSFSLGNYERVIANPTYALVLVRTMWIAFATTVAALLLGFPVAYLMARTGGLRTGIMLACVLLPFWSSVLVRTAAWSVLLQRDGLVNQLLLSTGIIDQPVSLLYTQGAVLLGMTHVLLPFMILPIYGAIKNVPSDYMRAAAVLGAPRRSAFFQILLPLSLPGIWSGSIMVFLTALGFFVTPSLLGSPQEMMIATLISQQIRETVDWPFAAALVGLLTLIVMLLAVVFGKALRLEKMMGGS